MFTSVSTILWVEHSFSLYENRFYLQRERRNILFYNVNFNLLDYRRFSNLSGLNISGYPNTFLLHLRCQERKDRIVNYDFWESR